MPAAGSSVCRYVSGATWDVEKDGWPFTSDGSMLMASSLPTPIPLSAGRTVLFKSEGKADIVERATLWQFCVSPCIVLL